MRASGWLRLSAVILSLAVAAARAPAQQTALGLFHGQTDVGQVTKRGSVTYDAVRERYTIAGSGANMWFDRDDFHFVWRRFQGTYLLLARAQFDGPGVGPHRKLGWTVRSDFATGSPHVTAAVHGDGLVALQYRRTGGGATEEVRSPVTGDVIQLERAGDGYTLSVGRFGDSLAPVRVADLALGDTVYVGLFVCAHNDTVVERATFRDVRITAPARDGFAPYRDYIGSNLEILDVATGDRTIVYRSPESLQAPNWTKDGTALIYNSGGLLYRFDLSDRRPVVVNTGFATSNNNDHVLSFDGRTLGISHHSASDHNASIVYTVPVGGGTPRRVTKLGPSYLHGWSPDGEFLVYTGERGGEVDVYRIPLDGGDETPVTHAPLAARRPAGGVRHHQRAALDRMAGRHRRAHRVVSLVDVDGRAGDTAAQGTGEEGGGGRDLAGGERLGERRVRGVILDHLLDLPDGARGAGGERGRRGGVHAHAVPAFRLR